MPKQNRAAVGKQDMKRRRRAKPVTAGPVDGRASVAELSNGLIAAIGSGTIQAQATRLGDGWVQGAQRRAMATRIGQVQGNQHLQRVVASLKSDQQPATALSAGQQVPGNQAVQRRMEEAVQPGGVLAASEKRLVLQGIAQGMTNENRLTNDLYFRRHPEIERGTRLKRGMPEASEWLEIRDNIVRPVLQSPVRATVQPAYMIFESILRPLGQKLESLVGMLDSVAKTSTRSQVQATTTKDTVEDELTKTLQVAIALETDLRQRIPDYAKKGGFAGWRKEQGEDRYVCTTFAQKVFKEAGYDVSGKFSKRINIRIWKKKLEYFPEAEQEAEKKRRARVLREKLRKNRPEVKGVVTALVESGQGIELSSPLELKSGDFVQYWGKSLKGHVVQVVAVIPSDTEWKIVAHGCHAGAVRAYADRSVKGQSGVGVITPTLMRKRRGKWRLAKWRVYCVRPTGPKTGARETKRSEKPPGKERPATEETAPAAPIEKTFAHLNHRKIQQLDRMIKELQKGKKRSEDPSANKRYKEAQTVDTDKMAKTLGAARELIEGLTAGGLGVTEKELSRIQAYYYRKLNSCTPYFTQLKNLGILMKQTRRDTCNITSLAMVLQALGVTSGDFKDKPSLERFAKKFRPKFRPKGFAHLPTRMPDFLQFVAIYLRYKAIGGGSSFDAKRAEEARKQAVTGKTSVIKWRTILAIADEFGVETVAWGQIKSRGLMEAPWKSTMKNLKRQKKKGKINEDQYKSSLNKAQENLAKLRKSKKYRKYTAKVYERRVLQEIPQKLDEGGQVIVASPGHYMRLEGFYDKGVVIDDPFVRGKNYHMPWGEANRIGLFSSYRVLKKK